MRMSIKSILCLLGSLGLAQAEPVLHLSLDDAESIKQAGATSEGFAWFPSGVAGKAMGFDGIRTVVKVPAGKIPDLSRGFTVSAWVALEAYPWTLLAVVDQESKEQAGYFLGLHPEGYPGLWMADGNQWQECRSQAKLPLYEWNHLVGEWSPEAGMRLYVNGREVAAVKTSGRLVPAVDQDVWIGRNHTPRGLYSGVQLPDMAMQKPRPIPCSLDGLVDEVRIEAGALSASAIATRYQGERPAGARPLNPPKMPAGPDGPGDFGAAYTRLRYTDAWEHYWRVGEDPDVLVRFDRAPYRFVFWRGTSFVPCWVTGNGIWYANEFLETGENSRPGGAEPMADKQTRNSHVRIIENTAARVVVHWRYAPLYTDYSPAHVDPETGWSDWVDEYYTLYPDGVGVRKICVSSKYPFALPGKEPGQGGFREYHESLVINPPGTAPHDNIQSNGLTLANMDGQSITYSWAKGPPGKIYENKLTYPEYLMKEKPSYQWRSWLADIPNPNIHLVNLKSKHSPFVIVPPDGAMVDSYVREIKPERSIFPWWNHWPVTQIESGGRWAYATDRPSHSSLSHIYWAPYEQSEQGLTKIMLHGMTDGTATDLIPLAKSWLQPPALQVLDGTATDPHYDPAERAYRLALGRPESQGMLRLRLDCSPAHPAVNPALVVAGWGERPVRVSLNGRAAALGQDFRAGFTKTVAGTDLVLWFDRQATAPLEITVEAAPPAAAHAAAVASLRCEHLESPLGIDVPKPRLSWVIEERKQGTVDRGQRQSAYQILVASSEELLKKDKGDLWDSGKVESDSSVAIPYGGPALESGRTYHWRVRVWDGKGTVSSWSETSRWTMGKLKPGDWSARWIGVPPTSSGADLEGVVITHATYRTLDGKVAIDVTPILKKALDEKRIPFHVHFNDLGGDPAPNVVKELVVEYTRHGKPEVSSAQDFGHLAIPNGPVGIPAPWFRGEFSLTGKPESALATVHSPGYFELYVNGVKVGDDVLTPAVSLSEACTFTVTYDVARLLKPGKNCLGLWTAKGWADGIAVRAQLDAVVAGRMVTFGTGPDWKTRSSGYSHIGKWTWNNFGGDRIDAAAHLPDWCQPGIDTSSWANAVDSPAPRGAPVNQIAPLNRIGARIPAREIIPLADGRHEIDFGNNLTGWLRLKFPRLKAGQVVRLHFADRVFPDGVQASPIGNIAVSGDSSVSFPRMGGGHNLYQTYHQISEFVSAGVPGEEFCHKFNYAGFRYVVIEGLDTAPRKEDATALLVESALADTGSFECSDPLINRIHQVNRWTLRCLNLGGYMVDCPHRERMGYGDGQVSLEGVMMNFDASRFYEKWVRDWRLAQSPRDGAMPNIAPPITGGGGGPPWAGVIAALPWQHYLHYGDTQVLEDNFVAARRYVEYLDSRSAHEVLRNWSDGIDFLGDWVPPQRGMDTKNWPTSEMAELFCNCYRVYLWQLVENMATALGRTGEAEHARQRVATIRPAVHAAFYDAANKRYVIDEQIYYAMPLLTGVTPDSERPAVMANLVKCLVEKNKGHLDTGMLGTKFLLRFLSDAGRDDLVLAIYQKKDYPGWGYMVEQGATTLWEQWNGYWSQIHSCFASADNWLYQGLAGIRPDPSAPGFKQIIIKPAVVGDLTWVKGHHDSPYGRIVSNWKREGDKLTMEVTIPANSTATVYVPAKDAAGVIESNKQAAKAHGVKFLRMENNAAVYAVGSGSYRFCSQK